MGIWYTTREDVASALDIKLTARQAAQTDDAIDAGARAIEGALHRRFYPEVATHRFDWPDENTRGVRPWRLRLGRHELNDLTSLTAGGVVLSTDDVILLPDEGPPYRRIEADLSTSAAFGAGNTHQQAVVVAGVFGSWDGTTAPAGSLAEGLDASETEVQVTDSAKVGVGTILACENERMIVTDKALLDTGINKTGGASTAEYNDVTMTVSGAGLVVGEIVAQDSERMQVVDIAGTTITVIRAVDGTVLDTHSDAEDLFSLRSLTVVRGALGTTAAIHDTATALTKVVFPGLIRTLNKAEAINILQEEGAGWARVAGSGENERELTGAGLTRLWKQARAAYGRTLRSGAV